MSIRARVCACVCHAHAQRARVFVCAHVLSQIL